MTSDGALGPETDSDSVSSLARRSKSRAGAYISLFTVSVQYLNLSMVFVLFDAAWLISKKLYLFRRF